MISEIFYKFSLGLYLVPLSVRHMGNRMTNAGPQQVLSDSTDAHCSSQTLGSVKGRVSMGHSYWNGSQLPQTLGHMDKSEFHWSTEVVLKHMAWL